jgi:uncharacterized protein (DUF2147 family)
MKPWIAGIAAILIATSIHAENARTPDVVGLWLVKKKDVVVEVKPCSADSEILCGRIAWLDPKAKQQVDNLNPDTSLRARPLCGIRVMWDMKPDADEDGMYTGKIYKANNGTTYDASIMRREDGNLLLRGYIGVPLLGKDAVLTPVKKGTYPLCTQRKARARKPLTNSGQTPSNG